jgi:hypothetical protein
MPLRTFEKECATPLFVESWDEFDFAVVTNKYLSDWTKEEIELLFCIDKKVKRYIFKNISILYFIPMIFSEFNNFFKRLILITLTRYFISKLRALRKVNLLTVSKFFIILLAIYWFHSRNQEEGIFLEQMLDIFYVLLT